MFTVAAFQESVDPAGAFNALTAVPDQHLTVTGDDVRVPVLNQIIAVAGQAENTVAPLIRLTAPSLRRKTLLMVSPLNVGAAAAVEPGSPQAVLDLRRFPVPLVVGENLNAELLSNPAAAQIQSAVVWLADKSPEPVSGLINTVRATATATLVASAWSNAAIAFDEDLPRGRYQIVGMRAEAAGLVAARCVFPGNGAQGWRPGCLGCDAVSDIAHDMFRMGQMGVWGEFEDIEPPTIDFLSVSADTAETVYFDLIQVREGPGA